MKCYNSPEIFMTALIANQLKVPNTRTHCVKTIIPTKPSFHPA